jgi:uncharacterized protein
MSDTLTAAHLADKKGEASANGKFIWYELMTTDQDAAINFYGELVGWTASDSGQKDISYTIVSAGGQGVGGILQLTDKMRDGGARPGWLGYIAAADTDAKAREIHSACGRILMEPGDIPDVGRFAMAADPGGAPFYLLTPLPHSEQPPALDPRTPGRVSWHELYSSQGQQAAFAFYSALFGWETQTEMDMGPMGKYRIFGAGGEALGGMIDKPDNVPVSAWTYYINVAGIDAAAKRIEANGGKLIMGPVEVPSGSWVLQATDPQGAHFALISKQR